MKRKIYTEDILFAGFELMYEKGYHHTSIKDITTHLEIPKGSFYNHFQNKEEFGLAVLQHYITHLNGEGEKTLNDPKLNPKKRILRVFQQLIQVQSEMNKYERGCLLGNFCSELADVNEAFNTVIKNAFNAQVHFFETCIKEGKRDGSIQNKLSAKELAEWIVFSWQGAVLKMKADQNDKTLKLFYKFLKLQL